MDFKLLPLTADDIPMFMCDMQAAFQKGYEDKYGKSKEMVLCDKDIQNSLNKKGSIAYKAVVDNEFVGGAVVIINKETKNNTLDFLYVKPGVQSKGIGFKIWENIEKLHSDTKVWETCTPYFEKRNINFYINKCGFYAVKYLSKFKDDSNKYDFIDDGDFVFKKFM